MAEKSHNEKHDRAEDLFEAIRKGDLDEAERLIFEGASTESRDEKARTPLIICAEEGRLDLVAKLLELGADVNAVDDYGETALMAATLGGNLDIVKLLVSKGADTDMRNNEDATALDLAKEMGVGGVTTYLAASSTKTKHTSASSDSNDPDDDGPRPSGPAVAAPIPGMAAQQTDWQVNELEKDINPQMRESPYFASKADLEKKAGKPASSKLAYAGVDSIEEANMVKDAWNGLKSVEEAGLPEGVFNKSEERIIFDQWDNKQIRSVNSKAKETLERAGLELGDHTVDSVFRGAYISVLKPRSHEYKRFRKLWKHPDLLIDPRRWRDWTGAAAVRRYCLAEGIDISSLLGSHFIELYYVKDLKLILSLAEDANTHRYTVRQLKRAIADLREKQEDQDPGRAIIRNLDQSVPLLEEPGLVELCGDKDRVLEELSRAERKKIRSLIKERKPILDEWKGIMDNLEQILTDLDSQ